ncbi:hypothetical protein MSNKSG1_04016 [Marinobacter santoriniensis NKSG1]|uniref:Uncharacterized protein n=1 Tax=Marinobacter santoriniensis NKSG1 TaxID=1288826 RepID=M7D6Y2_9GAMM|nr:hypothetical protein MSNKSG1_04016 [Marinobacter santoriniensis NKSG1]
MHAVCGCPVYRAKAVGMRLDSQWTVEGQCVTGATVVTVRGNHFQMPQTLKPLIQSYEPGRMYTIIIRQENAHCVLR